MFQRYDSTSQHNKLTFCIDLSMPTATSSNKFHQTPRLGLTDITQPHDAHARLLWSGTGPRLEYTKREAYCNATARDGTILPVGSIEPIKLSRNNFPGPERPALG